MSSHEADIAIVGAGPVGMTMALDLARRGAEVCLIEARGPDEPPSAKCNTVSARTMEIFRGLGLAPAVRAAGLPGGYPTDVVWRTHLTGQDITRISLPSRDERFAEGGRSAPGFPDSDWLTPEPNHRISQLHLEPVLLDAVRSQGAIRYLCETVAERVDDRGDHTVVHARHRSEGPLRISARFAVGCDGGRSSVRKGLGIPLNGNDRLSRTRTSLIRAPDLRARLEAAAGPGGRLPWMSWIINPEVTGTVVAIDGRELWLAHRNVPRSAAGFDTVDPDASLRALLGVGADFTYQVVHHEDWTARRLVAERFRRGNVFIAGDAAHIWIPFAGYGMNAGIADATNLSWMLAAVVNRWGHADLLDAHERERIPITEQVSRFAMDLALANLERHSRRELGPALRLRGPEQQRAWQSIGPRIRALNLPQFACEGLNFGYYYDASPVIAYDDGRHPEYTMGRAVPSTVPGCRLPHAWLDGQVSLLDALGPEMSLVRLDARLDVAPFQAAAAARKIPLTIVDLPVPGGNPGMYGKHLLLVRPDQHVAWRGDACPDDALALMDLVRGARPPPLQGDRSESGVD